jgi:hypothetical protein
MKKIKINFCWPFETDEGNKIGMKGILNIKR